MTQTTNMQESKRIVVELTMSAEDARKVIWTGRGPREPMGKLLADKFLDSRDLAWAIDKAYNPQVRAAARTLLAEMLGRLETIETTRRYGPEVIEGSYYLEQERDWNMSIASLLIGLIVGMLYLAIFETILKPQPLQQAFQKDLLLGSTVLGILILTLGGLPIVFFWIVIRPYLDDYKNFRRALDGEDAVAERLRSALDNRWVIFRNLKLPDRKDDLDIVLTGPGGIWVLEVKAYGGTVRFQDRRWERQTKRGWKRLDRDPAHQARKNAQRLNDYLRRQAIPIHWVETAVVLSEPQPITNFQSSETPVWLLPQVEDKAINLTTRTPPTEKEIEKIGLQFRTLAEKQKAREEASILRRIWP